MSDICHWHGELSRFAPPGVLRFMDRSAQLPMKRNPCATCEVMAVECCELCGLDRPNPGSNEALDRGCTCPVLDNGHGRGRGDGNFVIMEDCPLHGTKTPCEYHGTAGLRADGSCVYCDGGGTQPSDWAIQA